MTSLASPSRAAKRSLILHDTLIFLALCAVSIALFLVTLLLFRSFEDHRQDLGRRWAERGRLALQHGHPADAVTALRTALTYRDDLPSQLLLAQALAASGHADEASAYFLNLHETRPGDGFINLQLARLRRNQGEATQAVDFYRAAIFGNWEGDGALRRREVRLELATYLASRGNFTAARDEILIAAGNSPETPTNDNLFAAQLAAVDDPANALHFYQKSLALKPHQPQVLAQAGRLAYTLGLYPQAAQLLANSLVQILSQPGGHPSTPEIQAIQSLASDARRIQQLSLSRDLPAAERASHILLAARIAQARLAACAAYPPTPPTLAVPGTPPGAPPPAPVLLTLRSRWADLAPQITQHTLARNAALEDTITQLIFDTEQQTVTLCGTPRGDDALLLRLATAPAAAATAP